MKSTLMIFVNGLTIGVTDLYFCSSEEEVHRIQKMALKDINNHDDYYIKRIMDERQKYFMDLGV